MASLVGVALLGAVLVTLVAWWVASGTVLERWCGARRRGAVRAAGEVRERIGAAPAFVVVLAAGVGAVGAVGWVLGLAARACQPLDTAVYHLVSGATRASVWSALMVALTQMSNVLEYKVVAALAAVVLAVAYRRHWWRPVLLLGCALVVERQLRVAWSVIIDRGHPPAQTGTFPSGGCTRLLVVYGVILALLLAVWAPRSGTARRVAWTVFAVLAFLEGYSRVYLSKHWISDVVSGWLLGLLMLGCLWAAWSMLRPPDLPRLPHPEREAGDVATRHDASKETVTDR